MNRFIIFTSFILVLSLHLVVFIYYKNHQQNRISTLEKNQPLQIQLTKAYQKEQIKEEPKIIEKKVEEKKSTKEKNQKTSRNERNQYNKRDFKRRKRIYNYTRNKKSNSRD